MKKEKKIICVDESVKIAENLLKPIIRLLNTFGYFFMYDDRNAEEKDYFTVLFWSDKNGKKIKAHSFENDDEFECSQDMTYAIKYKGEKYYLQFYDSPDVCGFCSIYPKYDSETYIMCSIERCDENDDQIAQMLFGFDLEKMSFLELFLLETYEKKPTFRGYGIEIGEKIIHECQDIDATEKILSGKKLMGVVYDV